MRAAVLVYEHSEESAEAFLAWVDPRENRVLRRFSVPLSPNVAVFPDQDCALVSYTTHSASAQPAAWLDVYRLADWRLRARLPMDCHAQFNVSPQWPTFIAGPDGRLIYVYKSRSLGDHLAEDWVCGLDLSGPAFTPWNFKLPECVMGWSAASGRARAQMLFVSDGVEMGRMPTADLQQKLAFWLGPEEGMGPVVPLGRRPRHHSDLGHARAVLSAPRRPVSVVVCTDGAVHLIDPVEFRYLERQQVRFAPGHSMPIFAAQVDPHGRFLYVGTAAEEACHCGLTQRIAVHDLERGRLECEWVLEEPFAHMALTADGSRLLGVSPESNRLWVLRAPAGQTEAVMQMDGCPLYVLAGDRECLRRSLS